MSPRDRSIQSPHTPKTSANTPRRCFLASIAVLLGISSFAGAGTEPDHPRRPAAAGRVVRAFDFEEQDYNPLPVPLGWIRAQNDPDVPRIRPGFPIWNGGIIDYQSPAYSGIGTANLPTAGGSTSLILRRGEINIFPNADYLISARVRTVGLHHAKARVYAKLLDLQGKDIPGASVATPLVNTHGKWVQVSTQIEGVYPDAAFIQVELELLQPEQQSDQPPKSYTVWQQDYAGNAYFDNLIIAQLPRLEIATQSPGNIVESDTPPPLNVLVRDLTGDIIDAVAKIYDIHGQLIEQHPLSDGSKRVHTQWIPSLPAYGWYRAVLDVTVDGQTVGTQTLDFIWASPNPEHLDSGMFSLRADITSPKVAAIADQVIESSAITNASVELWNTSTTLEDTKLDSPAMQSLHTLVKSGINTSVILAELPNELATTLAIDPEEVRSTFAGPMTNWLDWGGELFDNFGQAVSDWQLGDLPTQEPPKVIVTQHDAIVDALMDYVPGPVIVTPWSIDRPIESNAITSGQQIQIDDSDATNEETMPIIVNQWVQAVNDAQRRDPNRFSSSSQPPQLAISISPLYEQDASGLWPTTEQSSAVARFARKAIAYWWAASSSPINQDRFGLELANAWRLTPGKRGQVMPTPELAALRTLAIHLANRPAIAQLDLMPGVTMLLAGPKQTIAGGEQSDTGIMILWINDPAIESTQLHFPLAMGPVNAYDLANNKTTLQLDRVTELDLPLHTINISREPIIITGVNTQLVQLLNSAKLTPGTIQSTSGIQTHQLHLANPWPMTIRGKVFIVEPGGYTESNASIDRSWEIRPRVIPFTLAPNEKQSFPIEIAHSLGELAGKKKLTFDIELEADMDYPLIRIEKSTSLGLAGIDMELAARQTPQGITLITARVTNNRPVAQDFDLVGIAPGEPRIRRTINALEPGQQVVREFAFGKAISGDQIVISLLLRDSSSRLNQAVTIP
ncbi:MAG: hypothetical protein ACWA5W_00385 [Phycisphaerales bacterium]